MVFFFKQKTAYEMRISDWSSDVCSSDLARHRHQLAILAVHVPRRPRLGEERQAHEPVVVEQWQQEARLVDAGQGGGERRGGGRLRGWAAVAQVDHLFVRMEEVGERRCIAAGERSEEHTSELQSLMRISYAVFCLKKKNIINRNCTTP